jgi:apolipoprotein N-acyltransferase
MQEKYLERKWIFLILGICSILVFSSPYTFCLLFVIFPCAFKIIKKSGFNKAIIEIFFFDMILVLIIFLNRPFINYFPLLIIAVLYFGILITLDYAIIYRLNDFKDFNVIAIFLYIVLSRTALSLSTFIFPFYWTLTMQLLPGIGLITYFLLPIFMESLIVSFSNIPNLLITRHNKFSIIIQLVLIILTCIIATRFIRDNITQKENLKDLNCGVIQLAFSNKDFTLASNYFKLSEKIALSYLQSMKRNKTAKLIILPESAFPIQQGVEGKIVEEIKDMASKQNKYILASMKIEENKNKFNSMLLINPNGEIAGIYKKRNIVPVVENYEYTKGVELNTFEVENYTIAPLICYDSVFIRNYFRAKKADLYVVTSNDVFSEHTILSMLHEAYSALNSRTLGIPLIQATQNGPSFYVDYKGKLILLAKANERRDVMTFTVKRQ